MIILLGPVGCGKEVLAQRLAKKYPHLLKLLKIVVCPLEDESFGEIIIPGNEAIYEEVESEEFYQLIQSNGLFLNYSRRGCAYGIRSEDVDDAARNSLGVVCCLDTAGVVDLIGSLIKPVTVYFNPENEAELKRRVQEVGYDEKNTERVVSGLQYSKQIRKEYIGFFEGSIATDNLDYALYQ